MTTTPTKRAPRPRKAAAKKAPARKRAAAKPAEPTPEAPIAATPPAESPAETPAPTGVVVPFEQPMELLPTVPHRDEFVTLAQMARVMADSKIVPKQLQGKPHDVFLVLWTGRDLGIPITSALREVHPIDGQPSLSPKLKLARVRQLGLGRVIPDPLAAPDALSASALALSNERCRPCEGSGWARDSNDAFVACGACHTTGLRPMGPPMTFTWADAVAAGLVKSTCSPTEHTCRSQDGKYGCKDNWRKYPQRMLAWRAAGYCVDDYYPEAGMGLYAPDELGAVTNEEGEVIDIDSVDMPKGYERVIPPGEREAPPEEVWRLQRDVLALGAEGRKDFGEQARRANVPMLFTITEEQGRVLNWLSVTDATRIASVLRGSVARLEREGYDMAESRALVDRTLAAVVGPLVGMGGPPGEVIPPDPSTMPPDAQEPAPGDAVAPPADAPAATTPDGPPGPAGASQEAYANPGVQAAAEAMAGPMAGMIPNDVPVSVQDETIAKVKLMSKADLLAACGAAGIAIPERPDGKQNLEGARLKLAVQLLSQWTPEGADAPDPAP